MWLIRNDLGRSVKDKEFYRWKFEDFTGFQKYFLPKM